MCRVSAVTLCLCVHVLCSVPLLVRVCPAWLLHEVSPSPSGFCTNYLPAARPLHEVSPSPSGFCTRYLLPRSALARGISPAARLLHEVSPSPSGFCTNSGFCTVGPCTRYLLPRPASARGIPFPVRLLHEPRALHDRPLHEVSPLISSIYRGRLCVVF